MRWGAFEPGRPAHGDVGPAAIGPPKGPMGDAIVARWVSGGSADSISDLDIEGLTDKLFACLGCELDARSLAVKPVVLDRGSEHLGEGLLAHPPQR